MKSIKFILVSLTLGITLSSCYRMTIETGKVGDIYLTRPHETSYSYTVIGVFKDSFKGSWLFWGLLPLKEPNLERALRNHIMRYQGDAIINLQLKTIYDPLDVIIGFITVGIFNTRTVNITGNVIKISPQGLLPIKEEVTIVLKGDRENWYGVCGDPIGRYTRIYLAFYPGIQSFKGEDKQ